MRIIITSILILLSLFSKVQAQNDSLKHKFSDNLFISAQYGGGILLAHRASLASLVNEYPYNFSIEIGKSTWGDKSWQQIYKYPSLGIGYLHTSLGNETIFGHADAVYAFMDSPYFRKGQFSFNFKFGLGLAYVSNKFNLEENIYNIAIGSNFNYLVHFNFDFKYNLLDDKLFLKTGLGFNHMSNGKMQTPNLGLNLLDWHLSAGYYLGQRKNRITKKIQKRDKHIFMAIVSGGVKEFTEPNLGKYFAGNITLEYEHPVGNKIAFGAGTDYFYDGVIHQKLIDLDDTKASLHAGRLGVHASYSINYSKISFIVQLGVYINPYYKDDGLIYDRIGFRYKITNHIVLNTTMKTHWGRADIIEFGMGYYFSK